VIVDLLSGGGGGVKPMGRAICLGVDRLGPWWTRSFMEKLVFNRVNLSDVRVVMMIMCVFMEGLLDGDGTNLSTHVPVCQGCVGACGYILSCQALNVIASQRP
jgi:hypothetical protein